MAISMVRAIKNAVDQTKELNLRLSNYKNKLLSFLAEYKMYLSTLLKMHHPHYKYRISRC